MEEPARIYQYVGPAEVLAALRPLSPGRAVLAPKDIAVAGEPFTFVIDVEGTLRLAPRRSEHVACAGGGPVLSAGEITFERGISGLEVTSATNQSTGYCPETSSWPAVARALDRIGVSHPGRFTDEFTFRRCPQCGERNIVRDSDFTCAICEAELPVSWNFDSVAQRAEQKRRLAGWPGCRAADPLGNGSAGSLAGAEPPLRIRHARRWAKRSPLRELTLERYCRA